nr:MAG TPA: hypothetical protein [Caudoviricetes sp.]
MANFTQSGISSSLPIRPKVIISTNASDSSSALSKFLSFATLP